MLANRRAAVSGTSASHVLGGKLDSVLAPFLLEPHTGNASIFFGTMVVVVAVGACIPMVFGRETVGNLETFTEALPELA